MSESPRARKSAEWMRGFEDGVDRAPCKATSSDYLRGYEYGREVARIGMEPPSGATGGAP